MDRQTSEAFINASALLGGYIFAIVESDAKRKDEMVRVTQNISELVPLKMHERIQEMVSIIFEIDYEEILTELAEIEDVRPTIIAVMDAIDA